MTSKPSQKEPSCHMAYMMSKPTRHIIIVERAMTHRTLYVTTLKGYGRNIIMLHYPPYCSKYNPIEHCVFGPITRSWSETPLLTIKVARARAESTTTKKGLSIIATINQRTYETKRPINESYESEKSGSIVFDDSLPK